MLSGKAPADRNGSPSCGRIRMPALKSSDEQLARYFSICTLFTFSYANDGSFENPAQGPEAAAASWASVAAPMLAATKVATSATRSAVADIARPKKGRSSQAASGFSP